MIKSYSRLNILQQRLTGQARGLIHYFFASKQYVTIEVPYYDYLRGRVFINDLYDNFGEEIYVNFDISSLIHVLYTDFLTQIKKDAKNKEVANYLVMNKEKFMTPEATQKRIMKKVAKNLFSFDTVEEYEEETESSGDKKAFLTFRARESDILRGEVLLHDLSPYLNGIEITVEELIAILYLDFLDNIKTDGNSRKTQLSILAHLKRFH